jgi:hypothetical protein
MVNRQNHNTNLRWFTITQNLGHILRSKWVKNQLWASINKWECGIRRPTSFNLYGWLSRNDINFYVTLLPYFICVTKILRSNSGY